MRGDLPAGFDAAMSDYKKKLSARQAQRRHPQVLGDGSRGDQRRVPETIGGSADLTGSNNTKSSGMKDVAAG